MDDGSGNSGTKNGGSGVFIQRHATFETVILKKPAGTVSSSYRAEVIAIIEGAKWTVANASGGDIGFLTDSKSLVEPLNNGQSHKNWPKLHELSDALLETYLHRIGRAKFPTCPCGTSNHDPEHLLLNCRLHEDERRRTLGLRPFVETLWDEPRTIAAFLRRTGHLGPATLA